MGFHGDSRHDLKLFQISKCTRQIGIKMLEGMNDDSS